MTNSVKKPTVMKLIGPRGCGKTTFAQNFIIADVSINETDIHHFNSDWLHEDTKIVVIDDWSGKISIDSLLTPELTVETRGEPSRKISNEITWILICEGKI